MHRVEKYPVSLTSLRLWVDREDFPDIRKERGIDTNPSSEAAMIPAAGGLVWRDSPHGKVLAVVHRTRHGGDWTLPKGKLQGKETWLDGARREVKEETGCQVQVESFAGSLCYHADGKPKVVRFWHMSVVEEPGQPSDTEVDTVDWLPVGEACTRLTHLLERALLESAQPAPASIALRSRLQRWCWSLLRSNSYHRLAQALPTYRIELENLIAKGEKTPGAGTNEAVAQGRCSLLTARRLLDRAEQALRDNDTELGWRCFKAATRFELYSLFASPDRGGFKARAKAILREAKEKLTSWRKDLVVGLLSKDDNFNENVSVDEVVYAAQILHEHQDNVYHKLQVVKRQLTVLSIVAVVTLVVWFIAARAPSTGAAGNQLSLAARGFAGAVVMFGIMGAAVSGILSTAKGRDGMRIPDQLLDSLVILARLVVGAVSALAVATFLISGVLTIVPLNYWSVLAAAFASGFSERLVVRAIETVSK